MSVNLKHRMAQKRMKNEEQEDSDDMPIEDALSSMTEDMVDHLNNVQMRTMLKQAIEYFKSE